MILSYCLDTTTARVLSLLLPAQSFSFLPLQSLLRRRKGNRARFDDLFEDVREVLQKCFLGLARTVHYGRGQPVPVKRVCEFFVQQMPQSWEVPEKNTFAQKQPQKSLQKLWKGPARSIVDSGDTVYRQNRWSLVVDSV